MTGFHPVSECHAVVETTLLAAEVNIVATALANRTVDASGDNTIGAREGIFENVAADLVSALKATVSGVTTD